MISKSDAAYGIRRLDDHRVIEFAAMASDCEILVRSKSQSEVDKLASLSLAETRRIERKFSRYRDDNIIHAINTGDGDSVAIDEETARLLQYVDQCHKLSGGLFDITSGVLRRAWKFDGSVYTPDQGNIDSVKELVGWEKVKWSQSCIQLLPGMEIDLGGIGKEYAVDRVAEMLFNESGCTLMANFGGDIRAVAAATDHEAWVVGIENPGQEGDAVGEIKVLSGSVATSGDMRRFCIVDGHRLGHILNPLTGWPVEGAPRSVTVLGEYCTEAGLIATLSILQGENAEEFLKSQGVKYHCVW